MRFPAATILFASILLAQGQQCFGEKVDKKQEAKALLSSALEAVNIQSPGAPPFKLTAQVTVNFKKSFDGSYTLFWMSPQKWREEIVVSDYRETTVRNGDKKWVQRNLPFPPLQVAQLTELMRPEFLSQQWQEGAIIQSVKDRYESGVRLKCIGLLTHDHGPTPGEFCIDAGLRLVMRRSDTLSSNGTDEFSDFAPFAGKQYPRTQRAIEDGKDVVKVSNAEIVPANPSDALFAGLAGVDPQATCDAVKPGKLVQLVPPEYPAYARQMQIHGRVTLYAVIGTDGTVHDVAVVRTLAKSLDEAAVSAVRQWKYQPYLCHDSPVPVETNIEINFSPSP